MLCLLFSLGVDAGLGCMLPESCQSFKCGWTTIQLLGTATELVEFYNPSSGDSNKGARPTLRDQKFAFDVVLLKLMYS